MAPGERGNWWEQVQERWQKYRWLMISGLVVAGALFCVAIFAANNSSDDSPLRSGFVPQQHYSPPVHRHRKHSQHTVRRHTYAPPALIGLGAPVAVFRAHFPEAAAPLTEHGRVYSFETYFVDAPLSSVEATAIAESAMPSDATLESETKKPTCEQLVFASKTLGSLIEAPSMLAEFSSGSNSAGPYDPSDITNILFMPYFGPVGC